MIREVLVICASVTLAFSASAQTAPDVTSKVVTVDNRQHTIYDFDNPIKQYRVVIPEGLKTVRRLLVVANYYAGDSRGDWNFAYYREFMHLHGFAFVGSGVTAPPAQFTAKNLTPGYHVFSVLGTDAEGTVRTSDPKVVVVRTPPTDVPTAQQ